MVVVDLTAAPVALPPSLLDGLPRRVGLTLPELRWAAHLAGGAPLPFPAPGPAEPGRLGARLGSGPSPDPTAYDVALAGLPEPATALTRRGLLGPDGLDPGLAGAVGLLAAPVLAVDLDVRAGETRARAWHRQRGDAVAALATADGLLFELAWCTTAQWADELARVARVPEDPDAAPTLPPLLTLPYSLADAAVEALRTGRAELLVALLDQEGGIAGADGELLGESDALGALTALCSAGRGRLRALLADVRRPAATPVGVVSWLLADGWHALEPGSRPGVLQVRAVDAAELAAALGPRLAEVAG